MNLKKNIEKFKQLFFEKFKLNKEIHVFWWSPNREDGLENYGDILNYYLVSKLSNKKIIHLEDTTENEYNKYLSHYFVVGSILQFVNSNSRVWGSGIISSNEDVENCKVFAVRGPRTRKRLLELNIKIPEVYGDPAILVPNLIKENTIKKYELGIIPHYVDFEYVENIFRNDNNIKVIKLLTSNIEETTKEITLCKKIISSSLHGVVVPQAYNIPSLWVKFSDKLHGDDVKFFDYFESLGIEYKEIIYLKEHEVNYDYLMNLFLNKNKITLPERKLLKYRKKELIKNCPFIAKKVKKKILKDIKNE
jgi:hypothetical protein